ncbi:MAG: DUF2344 domain-containing protein [Chloroflexi bacterium]|nr:DUF2344 domain-containing protein [Chloroflexota bacterium]
MQRLCITFARGEGLKFLAHLDLLRLWHRVLRRAGLPLAYSQGYSPSPRLSLACPLPVGVTSEGELLEFLLRVPGPVERLRQSLVACVPSGLAVLQLRELPLSLSPLASLVRWASYQVEGPADRDRQELEQARTRLLSARSIPWQHTRDTGLRRYDLRPLVLDLELLPSSSEAYAMRMRLRCDSQGTGRPEQVVAALGLSPPLRVHRLEVGLAA